MSARCVVTVPAILVMTVSAAHAFGAGGPGAMSHNGDRFRQGDVPPGMSVRQSFDTVEGRGAERAPRRPIQRPYRRP